MLHPLLLATALAASLPIDPAHRAVFVSDRDGNPELYLLARGATTRLTENAAVDRLPSWSPDCSTIAFESERDGERRIWLIGETGANPRRLTNSTSRERYPAFSPGGSRIAAAVYGESKTADLFLFNPDGSNPRRLTDDAFEDAYPAWSPTGDRIAFHTYRHGKAEIYVMRNDGTNPSRLTQNDAGDYEPAWSPDGNTIAFVSDRDSNLEIYLMAADGSSQRRLTRTPGDESRVSWTPDGRFLLYSTTVDENEDLYRIEIATGEVTRLTDHPAKDSLAAWCFVDRSPLVRGTVAFALSDKELIPESVAYDPVARSFYVGSMYKRKIVKVAADGRQSDFVPQAQDGLFGVLGIKVDAERRELWANACNLQDRRPPMTPDEEGTRGQGGVFRYDLGTGRLIAKYLVGWQLAPRCFNDLVITPDGTVYFSSGPDGIYRVRPGNTRAELFVEYPSFINGIAASDDGTKLFLGDYLGVRVMDVATRTAKPVLVPDGESLAGIDGLYVRGRSLVAIQNGRRNQPERLLQAELSPSLDAVTCFAVLERARPDYDIPTTGVLVGDDIYYVASSQLTRFNPDKTIFPLDQLKESVIVRTPLQIPCK